MEIERKYLVKTLPDNLEQYPHYEIEQAYLCTSPTLRIRRMGDEYILTVKERIINESKAIHNREEEFSLSPDSYKRLLAKCDSGHIAKTRYKIDLYRQTNEGLLLVEVEFPNTDTANSFIPPDWFGEDVSADPMYRNSFLASMA